MSLKRGITAPIRQGDPLGVLEVYQDGALIDTQYLLAAEDVGRTEDPSILQVHRQQVWACWYPRVLTYTDPAGISRILTYWDPVRVLPLPAPSVYSLTVSGLAA